MLDDALPDFLTRDPDGYVRLTGHRVGLKDVIPLYNEGFSVEMLAGQFPTLPLALLHKVVAFYLERQQDCDAYLRFEQDAVLRQRADATGPTLAELRARLQRARAG
jgi:uncharacterized protein (DUF433 family)